MVSRIPLLLRKCNEIECDICHLENYLIIKNLLINTCEIKRREKHTHTHSHLMSCFTQLNKDKGHFDT